MGSNRAEFTDGAGRVFSIGECEMDDHPDLTRLYEIFSPKPITQGLPPRDDEMRRLWVEKIAKNGVNFAAWIDGDIVGHAAVIPDFDKSDGEYIIFILTPYRNKGLGSRLTQLTVNKARELSLERLWLTVESYNFRAIRVYKKVGFDFADSDELERTMILSL